MKVLACISLMSAPAAKARSLPVRTIAPMAGSTFEAVEGRAQLADQLGIERVERIGPVERDDPDRCRGVSTRMVS